MFFDASAKEGLDAAEYLEYNKLTHLFLFEKGEHHVRK